MHLKISEPIKGEVLYQKEYPIDFISTRGMEEEDGSFGYRSGKIDFYESWFEGMRIVSTHILPDKPSSLVFEMTAPSYIMKFCLEGQCKFKLSESKKDVKLKAGQSIFVHNNAGFMEMELSHPSKLICIQLTKKCYERLIPKGLVLMNEYPISSIIPAVEMILNSFRECRYSVEMKRIFLEAKVLELLLQQLNMQRAEKSGNSNVFLKKHDIEKIHYAKLLIEQNIQTPCSLIELAHKAGLNDFKLKKGFKELLGTTVFSYLNDIRMEKAKKMLTIDKMTVNEVSHAIGYKNPHHFTTAFKKKYGVLPSRLNKR